MSNVCYVLQGCQLKEVRPNELFGDPDNGYYLPSREGWKRLGDELGQEVEHSVVWAINGNHIWQTLFRLEERPDGTTDIRHVPK